MERKRRGATSERRRSLEQPKGGAPVGVILAVVCVVLLGAFLLLTGGGESGPGGAAAAAGAGGGGSATGSMPILNDRGKATVELLDTSFYGPGGERYTNAIVRGGGREFRGRFRVTPGEPFRDPLVKVRPSLESLGTDDVLSEKDAVRLDGAVISGATVRFHAADGFTYHAWLGVVLR